MIDNEEKVVAPPSVAQIYREGLHFAARAAELVNSPATAAQGMACAATAQACFTGVQAAAFAAMALESAGDLADNSVGLDEREAATTAWTQIVEMQGGR